MTTNSSAPHANVNPSEVGWQFVPQYYTFVNKEPHRLHCFYNKTSTFVHGTEGEDVKACHGQQEIHKKITSIGFEDCRVFIHSVDAQASANGGIIIQVIGEMSNHNEPWRKFVQTFFLAEQPNGYFVLNDIFRFLKEESVETDDACDGAEPETTQDADATPSPAPLVSDIPVNPIPAPEPVFEPPREATPPPPAPAVVVELALAVVPVEEAPQIDEPVFEPTQTPTPAPEQHPSPIVTTPVSQPNGHVMEPEKVAAAPAPAEVPERPTPSPAPPPTQTFTPTPPHHPVVAAPQQPSTSRSWASLAATDSKKWGAVAQDTKGVSEIVTPSPAPGGGAQTPTTPQTPMPSGGGHGHHHGRQQRNEHPFFTAAQNVATAHCFVKGVTEQVSQAALQQTLSRFGPIKDLDVVRPKACAFVEYHSVETARKSIIASLNHNVGGEGGIYVDAGGEQVRIFVETKKEKGDRPPSRPHRGAPGQQVNGGERSGPPQGGGNFRGRSGGQRGGRGGSQK